MVPSKNLQPVILLLLIEKLGSISENKSGNTKLQKLLFLIQKESKYKIENGFTFTPYKFGPYSDEFFDVLGALNQKGLIMLEQDSFGNVLSGALTKEGKEKLNSIRSIYSELDTSISKIISEYGKLTCDLLLLYVYTRYPDFTIKSEIKDYVRIIARDYFKKLQKKAKEIGFSEAELALVN